MPNIVSHPECSALRSRTNFPVCENPKPSIPVFGNAALRVFSVLFFLLSDAIEASDSMNVFDSAVESIRFSTNLDSFSLQCLSCHDDSTGDGLMNVNVSGELLHGGGSSGHPIGIDYAQATSGRKSRSYNPESRISNDIKFPDGKLSCISCHQLSDSTNETQQHGQLVMSNRGSALCFECHNL
jgi:hypothetical protein